MKKSAIIILACLLASISLGACGPSPDRDTQATRIAAEVFATQTAQASTATLPSSQPSPDTGRGSSTPPPTPADTPTAPPLPTAPPTPTPVPTATPDIRLGVPTSGGRWQVTVTGARQADKIFVGFYPDRTTYTPRQAGHTFLVVDFRFSSLDPAPQSGVPTQAITIIGADGQMLTATGIGGFGDEFVCAEDCAYSLKPAVHHLAFVVDKDSIGQPWRLQFADVPAIPFSLDEKAQYALSTQVGAEPGALSPTCRFDKPAAVDVAGRLSYSYWVEGRLTLASVAVDRSASASICTGVAFANLRPTGDGGSALQVGPLRGWPDLYMIEPDGKVYILVKNGPAIDFKFDPSGRYLFFTTTKLGEENQEALYVFDRSTASTTLLKAGDWVNFEFFANGHLLVTVKPSGSDKVQSFLSQAGVADLQPLSLPQDVDYYDIADDGEHLVYSKIDDKGNDQLFIADLDGGHAKKLATTKDTLGGRLSPNGQFILVESSSILEKEKEFRYKVELYDLATNERWTIAEDIPSYEIGFSADSRWALVTKIVEGQGTAEDQTTSYLVSTSDGRIAHEIEHVINAVFSPDSRRLAYTVRQADGSPAMSILSLASGETQTLGTGVVRDWLSTGIPPSASASTPTAEKSGEAASTGQAGDTIGQVQVSTPTPTPTRVLAARDAVVALRTPTPRVTPTQRPPKPPPTPSQSWVLVADSAADFPGRAEDRHWDYLWSNGRNNFIWQAMAESADQCFASPNDWRLQICRDQIKVDTCGATDLRGRGCARGDAALLWKARQGGTYRFEWDSTEADGKSSLWFYKHLDLIGSQGPGTELPYSAVVENAIDWELFFWVPQYDTSYRIKIYKLQE